MILKINESLQYEVESAVMADGQIIAVRTDGTNITIGGDLENIEVIGGEIVSEPTQLDQIEAQVAYTALMTDTLLDYEEE